MRRSLMWGLVLLGLVGSAPGRAQLMYGDFKYGTNETGVEIGRYTGSGAIA